MKAEKILTLGELPEWVQQELSPPYQLVWADDASRADILNKLDPSVVALIARGSARIDAPLLEAAPGLRIIARTGVGYDSVDVAEATRRRIPVVYTPGAMAQSVAEHTLMLMLAAVKQLPRWQRLLRQGEWNARYRLETLDLEGATVGIVGYGRIGTRVRRLLEPFRCRILVNDPYLPAERYQETGVSFVSLEELLAASDIVTLHVPLTEETRHLINRQNLGKFKPGAILVNTARGAVVESHDLLLAGLQQGRLAAVALDVFAQEPPDLTHPLFAQEAVVATGHVAARSRRAQRQILQTVLKELQAILAGERPDPENLVNPEVLSC